MQQNHTIRSLTLSTFLTGLLLCWNPLFAADPLTDPDNTPDPVIDTVAPNDPVLTRPAVFVDPNPPNPNFYEATRAIVTPDFATEITSKVVVTDDVEGNSVDFTFNPTGKVGPLIPGQYTITWTATDLGLNSTSVEQTLNVLPTINFSPDQTVGEGGTAIVTAHLSGESPVYPFTVGYFIDNTNNSGGGANDGINDHSLAGATGSLTFNEGETEKSISIDIYADADNDINETIGLTLDTANFPDNTVWAGAGQKTSHTITITQPDTNHAPLAHLSASQGGKVTRAITISGGTVTITADANDANGDTIQYDWSATDNALAPTSSTTGSSFTFEPLGLAPGFYTARLTVSDAGGLSTSQDMLLVLLETEPELSSLLDSDNDKTDDATEGFQDDDNDGIPNYLDAINTRSDLIQGFEPYVFNPDLKQQDTLVTDSITLNWKLSTTASNLVVYPLLLAVDPGLHINIGPTAFAANSSYARISTSTAENLRGVSVDENLVSTDGQVMDIEITHLNQTGDNARIIVPQTSPIPPSQPGTDPAFKVFTNEKQWADFNTDEGDQLKTDMKEGDAYCPDFAAIKSDATLYTSPLATGKECLLITVKDGGPNDYDGVANGTVRLMGSVFITSSSISSPPQTDGGTFTGNKDATTESLDKLELGTGNGGGSLGFIALFSLLIASLLRWCHKPNQ